MSEEFIKRPKKRRSSILKPSTDISQFRSDTTISRRVSFSRSKNVQEYIIDNPPVESAFGTNYLDDMSSLRHTEDEDSKALSFPSLSEDSIADKSVFFNNSDEVNFTLTENISLDAILSLDKASGREKVVIQEDKSVHMEMTRISNHDDDDEENIEKFIFQEAERSFALLDTSGQCKSPSDSLFPIQMDVNDKENNPLSLPSRKPQVSKNKTLRESMGMDLTLAAENITSKDAEFYNDTRKNKTVRESIGMDMTLAAEPSQKENTKSKVGDFFNDTRKNKTVLESMGMDMTLATEPPQKENTKSKLGDQFNDTRKNKTVRESMGMDMTLATEPPQKENTKSKVGDLFNDTRKNKTVRESMGMDMTLTTEPPHKENTKSKVGDFFNDTRKNKTIQESIGMDMTLATEPPQKENAKSLVGDFFNDTRKNKTVRESMGMDMTILDKENKELTTTTMRNKTRRESEAMNFTMANEHDASLKENQGPIRQPYTRNTTLREPIGMNITMAPEDDSSSEKDKKPNANPEQHFKRDKTLRESIAMNITMAPEDDSGSEEDKESNANPEQHFKRDKTLRESIAMNITMAPEDDSGSEEDKEPNANPEQHFKRDKTLRESIAMNITMAPEDDSGSEEDKEPNANPEQHFKRDKTQVEPISMSITMAPKDNSDAEENKESYFNHDQHFKREKAIGNAPFSIDKKDSEVINPIQHLRRDKTLRESVGMNLTLHTGNDSSLEESMESTHLGAKAATTNRDPKFNTNQLSSPNKTGMDMTLEDFSVDHMDSKPMKDDATCGREAVSMMDVAHNVGHQEKMYLKEETSEQRFSKKDTNVDDVDMDGVPNDNLIQKNTEQLKRKESSEADKSYIKRNKTKCDYVSEAKEEMISSSLSTRQPKAQSEGSAQKKENIRGPERAKMVGGDSFHHVSASGQRKESTLQPMNEQSMSNNEESPKEIKKRKIDETDIHHLSTSAFQDKLNLSGKKLINNKPVQNIRKEEALSLKGESSSPTPQKSLLLQDSRSKVEELDDSGVDPWVSKVDTPSPSRLSRRSPCSSVESSFNASYHSFSVDVTPKKSSQGDVLSVFHYYEKEQATFEDGFKYADFTLASLSEEEALLTFMEGCLRISLSVEPLHSLEQREGGPSISHWRVKDIQGSVSKRKDATVNFVMGLMDASLLQSNWLKGLIRTTSSFRDFLGLLRPHVEGACRMIIAETKIFYSHPNSGFIDPLNPNAYLVFFFGYYFNFTISINFDKGLNHLRKALSIKSSTGPINGKFLLDLASKSKQSWGFLEDYVKKVDLYVQHMDSLYLKSMGIEP